MDSTALLKYIKDRWDSDEDAVEQFGELHGESLVDEGIELPYARCAVECSDNENQTGDTFLNYYYILIAVYGVQNSNDHRLASKKVNSIFYGKNCRFDEPDDHITVLHILPLSHKFENIATLAGRDILVSEHKLKMLAQTDNLNPDD